MKFWRYYIYNIVYWPVWVVMGIWHFHRFSGRENVPEGPAVVCCNHSGLADPVWAVLVMHDRIVPWIMAKKSVVETPVLGAFLRGWGAFGVDRDHADLEAVKKSLRVLRDGEKLLIFPEGTRMREGKQVAPKSGAVMIANRAGVPLLPVYISPRKYPFQKMRCVVGQPYTPQLSGKRPSPEELNRATEELMQKIYRLGEEQ
ncbi:MAG: lysophospholipid acyltransferase family protein [Candidatus Faecousia sp.]|nr:lysophospholipid acyltransferase family protein [Candidatus Faecousia sp.]